MVTQGNNYVKIAFRFYSEVLDEEIVETIWAIIVNKDKGLFKIDNIPFYVPFVAIHDIVFAMFDRHEQQLTYQKTVEYSGYSTVQVVLLNESIDINQLRDEFKELGCISEKMSEAYFSMAIPSNIDYKNIKKKLDELETQEILSYAEPVLADGHRQ